MLLLLLPSKAHISIQYYFWFWQIQGLRRERIQKGKKCMYWHNWNLISDHCHFLQLWSVQGTRCLPRSTTGGFRPLERFSRMSPLVLPQSFPFEHWLTVCLCTEAWWYCKHPWSQFGWGQWAHGEENHTEKNFSGMLRTSKEGFCLVLFCFWLPATLVAEDLKQMYLQFTYLKWSLFPVPTNPLRSLHRQEPVVSHPCMW